MNEKQVTYCNGIHSDDDDDD